MKREIAWRIFAKEFNQSKYSFKSSGERSPNYVVTPTGAKCNRLFSVGVLTEVEKISENVVRAKLSDPTDMFTLYAGNFQEKPRDYLIKNEAPYIAAVTGKAKTFEGDNNKIFTSIRPERIDEVNQQARNNWLITTAKRTLERIKSLEIALESGFTGEELIEYLKTKNVRQALAEGISIALEEYEIDAEENKDIVKEALSTFTGIETEGKDPKKAVKKAISELDRGKGVNYSRVIEKSSEMGFEEQEIEEAVNELMEEGKCYEPKLGKLKLI